MAFYFATSEESNNEVYTTHYYKASYNALKDSILNFCKQNNFKVIDFNDEYHEACIANEKIILNLSFNIISVIKVGIDFTIEADYFMYARKNTTILLNKIYDFLGKNHQLLAVGIKNVK